MGQKFLISEGEKTHIRKLYGLITEAVEPYTQSQRVTFNPGYYGRTYAAPFLDPIIENIKKYLLDRPGERFVVNVAISSGESQIPNTDNEGVITGKAGTALAPKQLAIQRGVTITDYLNEKLGGLVESGVLPSLPKYTIADPKIGDTAWVGTPFCPAGSTDTQQRGACKDRYKAGKETTYKDYFNAYQQEQYLDMSITITELPAETPTPSVPVTTQTPTIKLEECASTIRVRFEIKKHNCQNAEFFVFANDTRLNNMEGGMTANLNTGTSSRGIPNVSSNPVFPPQLLNPGYGILTQKYGVNVKGKTKDELISGFKDAARWDDFEIPSSDKEKILSQSLEVSPTSPFINIWFECVTSDAHDDIVTITVYDGNNNVIVAPFSPKGSQGLLCTLDKCGKKIKTINDRIGPSGGNIRQARGELITYKEGLMSNLGLSGDTSTLDTKGLSLERTRTLLNKIKDIATKFNEYYTKMTASKNEAEKSNLKKSFKTYLESELTQFFRITMKSEGYEELLRKDPTDADSYPRSLIKSDMGGDLKNRMDTFYKYFNTFYRLGNTGEFLINNINQNTIYNISKNVNSDIT